MVLLRRISVGRSITQTGLDLDAEWSEAMQQLNARDEILDFDGAIEEQGSDDE